MWFYAQVVYVSDQICMNDWLSQRITPESISKIDNYQEIWKLSSCKLIFLWLIKKFLVLLGQSKIFSFKWPIKNFLVL